MNFTKNLKISQKLWLLLVFIVISISAFGIYSFSLINDVKVNGKLYQELKQGYDLVADILPPPEYIIEANLVAYQMYDSKDKKQLAALIDKDKELENEYYVRHEYWKKNLDKSTMKQIMVVEAYKSAAAFFKIMDSQYIPALKAGNIQAAHLILTNKLEILYTKHRSSINKVVKLADNSNNKLETSTAQFIHSRSLFVFILFLLIVAVIISTFSSVIKTIKKPIHKLIEVVNKVASGNEKLMHASMGISSGDLSVKLKKESISVDIERKDEIGELASSVQRIVKSQDELSNSFDLLITTTNDILNETLSLTNSAVEGNLQFRASGNKFNGSYKNLIEGINNILDTMLTPVIEGGDILTELANGNLTSRIKSTYKGDHQLMKNSINSVAQSLYETISKVTASIQATASAAEQISSSSAEMATGAQEQSAQTTEVAGAVEEMTKTIIETTKNSVRASEVAKKSGALARDGGQVVTETINGMERIASVVQKSAETVQVLGKRSNEIGEIVHVIDDIADQTNLLALNAAIEAARAGEQGLGFAVVADEVRKLAERTTKATKEIADMIKQIQKDTNEAVSSMNEGTEEVKSGMELAAKASASLKQIITGAEETVDISSQVAAASEEQSATAEQIGRNIEAINNVTQVTAQGIQQIVKAAEDLNKLTIGLQNLIGKFRIDNFNELTANGNDEEENMSLAVNY